MAMAISAIQPIAQVLPSTLSFWRLNTDLLVVHAIIPVLEMAFRKVKSPGPRTLVESRKAWALPPDTEL